MSSTNNTGLSSLSMFIGTTWFVENHKKSVLLVVKVAVNPCKSNYLQWFVYRGNIYLSFKAPWVYFIQPLDQSEVKCQVVWKDTFLSVITGQDLVSLVSAFILFAMMKIHNWIFMCLNEEKKPFSLLIKTV